MKVKGNHIGIDKTKIVQVCSYQTYGHAYADHAIEKGVAAEGFFLERKPNAKFQSKSDVVRGIIYGFIKMTLNFWKFRNVKIYSSGGGISCMLFARLFGKMLGNKHHLYLHYFYLHSLGKNKYVQMVLRFLMNNDNLTLIAQTPGEIDFYRRLSERIKILFVPYCSDVKEQHTDVKLDDGYIFTGGYTNRDYSLMLQLAKRMPKRRFLFVASKLNKGLNNLPSNVELKRDVSPQEFGKLMEGASIVVVPLKEDVGSSGQMLCIQSMRYHKPIVYTDVSSINYYFTKTSGIPYEMGSLDSLQKAVSTLYADEESARKMGDNAYNESLKYTSANGLEMIDKIVLGC